jgi:hypothetical protein
MPGFGLGTGVCGSTRGFVENRGFLTTGASWRDCRFVCSAPIEPFSSVLKGALVWILYA